MANELYSERAKVKMFGAPKRNGSKTGSKRLRYVRRASLDVLVQRAVARALRKNDYEHATIFLVLRDVRKALQLFLKNEGRSIRGYTKSAFIEQLESSHKQLLVERGRFQREITELRERVDRYRASAIADEEALKHKLVAAGDVQDRELASRLRLLFAQAGKAIPSFEDLEKEILLLTGRTMHEGRQRFLEDRAKEHEKEIENYERRIAKLNKCVADSEAAIKNLAKMKNVDMGVASIYDGVQGLALEDDRYEQKKEMLRCVFVANMELQRRS
jgi:hypothetical protein